MIEFIYLFAAIGSTGSENNPDRYSPPPTPPLIRTEDVPYERRPIYTPPPLRHKPLISYPVPRGDPGIWVRPAIDYPFVARAQGREGTTGFELTVGMHGRVTDCKITSSSGYTDLDRATCNNLFRRARFMPAIDSSGNPSPGKYRDYVKWQLPPAGASKAR